MVRYAPLIFDRCCGQVLPPHVLASLKGGARVMVEKFNDVCLLMADIFNFQDIAGVRCGLVEVG
jgi:hypothetical protein